MSSPNSLIVTHDGMPASARSPTSSNLGVSFTLPSPDALASPPSNHRIDVDSIDPSVNHFVSAIARNSVDSPQVVLPALLIERSTPFNQSVNGIVVCLDAIGPNQSTASITNSCNDVTAIHRVPPKIVPFAEIPSFRKSILRMIIKDAFNIDPPHDYQIEAINHLASNDDTYLTLVRKTADGKITRPPYRCTSMYGPIHHTCPSAWTWK